VQISVQIYRFGECTEKNTECSPIEIKKKISMDYKFFKKICRGRDFQPLSILIFKIEGSR